MIYIQFYIISLNLKIIVFVKQDTSKVYFDVDSQTNKEIVDRLVKTLGKTKQVCLLLL